jgi:hypothetical protein
MAEWRENQLPTPTERSGTSTVYSSLRGVGAGLLLISP